MEGVSQHGDREGTVWMSVMWCVQLWCGGSMVWMRVKRRGRLRGGEEFGWRSLPTNHLPLTHLRPAATQLSPLHRTPAPHFAYGADAPPLHSHSVDGYVVCIRGALVEV